MSGGFHLNGSDDRRRGRIERDWIGSSAEHEGGLVAPMPGKVLEVSMVAEGDER